MLKPCASFGDASSVPRRRAWCCQNRVHDAAYTVWSPVVCIGHYNIVACKTSSVSKRSSRLVLQRGFAFFWHTADIVVGRGYPHLLIMCIVDVVKELRPIAGRRTPLYFPEVTHCLFSGSGGCMPVSQNNKWMFVGHTSWLVITASQ